MQSTCVSQTSSSAIAERPCCRVGQLWPKVEDCNWERIFYRHYRSVFNHCRNWPAKQWNSV